MMDNLSRPTIAIEFPKKRLLAALDLSTQEFRVDGVINARLAVDFAGLDVLVEFPSGVCNVIRLGNCVFNGQVRKER